MKCGGKSAHVYEIYNDIIIVIIICWLEVKGTNEHSPHLADKMHEMWREVWASRKDDGSDCWDRRGYNNPRGGPSTVYKHWDSGWGKQVPLCQVGWYFGCLFFM